MKKKALILLCIVAALLTAIIVLYFWQFRTNSLLVMPEYTESVNYNNYSQYPTVDYRYGNMAWYEYRIFGGMITVVDETGETYTVKGISTDRKPRLQVHKAGVYYLDYEKLYCKPYQADSVPVLVLENVEDFRILEKGIVFICSNEDYEGQLYWFDFATKTKKLIAQKTRDFFASDDCIYFATSPGYTLYRYTDEGSEMVMELDFKALPLQFQLQGDNIVYKQLNDVYFANLETGETVKVPIVDSNYMLNSVSIICGERYVYATFQANSSDGSLIFSKDDPANGVWKIDSSTMKKTKLCDEYFNGIYLYDESYLIGWKDNHLYRISTVDGSVEKITN